MAQNLGTLTVKLEALTAEFKREMDGAEDSLQSVAETSKTVGKAAGVAFAAMAAGIGLTIRAAREQDLAIQGLANALKASGQAVDTAPFEALATSLQKVTLFGDEATLASAEMLTRFGATGDAVQQLLPGVQDLAAGLKVDLATSTKLVGRLLSGQSSVLTRYGLTLSDAQKEAIELGNEQQKVAAIMDVFSTSVDGAARTAAAAAGGGFIQLSNSLGDTLETIGGILDLGFGDGVLVIRDAVDSLNDAINSLSPDAKELFGRLAIGTTVVTGMVAALAAAGVALPIVSTGLKTASAALITFSKRMAIALGPIALAAAGILSVVGAIKNLGDVIDAFKTGGFAAAGEVARRQQETGIVGAIGVGLDVILEPLGAAFDKITDDVLPDFSGEVGKVQQQMQQLESQTKKTREAQAGLPEIALTTEDEMRKLGEATNELGGLTLTTADDMAKLGEVARDSAAEAGAALEKLAAEANAAAEAAEAEAAARAKAIGQTISGGFAGGLTGTSAGVFGAAQQGAQAGGLFGALAGAIIQLLIQTEGFQKAVESLNDALDSIVDALEPITGAEGAFTAQAMAALGPIIETLGELFTIIGELVGSGLNLVMQALGPILQAFNDVLQPLVPLFSIVAEVLSQIFDTISSTMAPGLALFSKLLGNVTAVVDGLIDAVLPVITAILSFHDLINQMGDAFSGVLETLTNQLGPVFDILGPIMEGLGVVLEAVADIISAVVMAVAEVWNSILGAIISVLEGLADFELFGEKPFGFLQEWADSLEDSKISIDGMSESAKNFSSGIATDEMLDLGRATDIVIPQLEAAGDALCPEGRAGPFDVLEEASLEVSASLLNVPASFNLARARLEATLPTVGGAPEFGGLEGPTAGTGVVIEQMTIETNDPELLADRLVGVLETRNFLDRGTKGSIGGLFNTAKTGGVGQ